MENMQEDKLSLFDLEVDASAQHSLEQASKWAKFLGIVFIVSAAILVLIMLGFSNRILSNSQLGFFLSGSGGLFVVILLAALALFTVFVIFLMRFSIFTMKGVREGNQENLEKGIGSLKVYYILLGSFGILILLISIFKILGNR